MSFPRPPRKEESTFDQWMLRLWQWLKDSATFSFGSMAEQNADNVSITGGTITATGLITTNGQVNFPSTQNLSSDANTLDDYREGTFTATATGMTTSPTGDVDYLRIGGLVVLQIPTISGTSNATTFTLTGIPTELRPSVTRRIFARMQDAGTAYVVAYVDVNADGTITCKKDVGGSAFTASGTKSIGSGTLVFKV